MFNWEFYLRQYKTLKQTNPKHFCVISHHATIIAIDLCSCFWTLHKYFKSLSTQLLVLVFLMVIQQRNVLDYTMATILNI